MITLDTVVTRNDKDFIASPIGEEMVMMSMENGKYIGINEVSTTIWQKLEQPTSVNDLVNYLLSIYDITKEECEIKTIRHLNELLREGMIFFTK